MSRLPDGPRGRVLALLLVGAVVVFGWLAVVAPLRDLYDARTEQLASQRERLAHMTRLVAALPALRQDAAAAGAGAAPEGELLTGDTDAIAGATLQGMVQDMAAAAGATLASAEALTGEQQGEFRQIGVRVALTARWPLLMGMLRAIETNQYRLLVDDLQLHASARLQAGAAASAPPAIDASFVVLGFRSGGASVPPRAALRADATAPGR